MVKSTKHVLALNYIINILYKRYKNNLLVHVFNLSLIFNISIELNTTQYTVIHRSTNLNQINKSKNCRYPITWYLMSTVVQLKAKPTQTSQLRKFSVIPPALWHTQIH